VGSQFRRNLTAIALFAIVVASTIGSAFAAPAVPAWRLDTPWTTETGVVRFKHDVLDVEIADTSELRERGLGYRDQLAPGTGMLFVYDSSSMRSFWMKGMRFCLDIVWIEGGEVKGAAENVCPEPGVPDGDLGHYQSTVPVTYVLEVPAGWLDEHGYDAGDPVEIELPESVQN
jgi:uncharacterized membrane protein (UPF0127 family)